MRSLLSITVCSVVMLLVTPARAALPVLNTYADIAHAVYEDSAAAARELQQRIDRGWNSLMVTLFRADTA